MQKILGYEPTCHTVHRPLPPRTDEDGFIFSYMCLVFPQKCPQRKACFFGVIHVLKDPKTWF